jgi:hypothetical protein
MLFTTIAIVVDTSQSSAKGMAQVLSWSPVILHQAGRTDEDVKCWLQAMLWLLCNMHAT